MELIINYFIIAISFFLATFTTIHAIVPNKSFMIGWAYLCLFKLPEIAYLYIFETELLTRELKND